MKFRSSEFDNAVSALCHGTIGDSELKELHELLRTDEDARDEYLWRVEVHGELASGRLDFDCSATHDPGRNQVMPTPPLVAPAWNTKHLLAVALVLLAIGGLWLSVPDSPDLMPEARTNDQPTRTGERVAISDPFLAIVIDQSSDVRWRGASAPKGMGHAIGRDRILLESGEATLQLDNGVELKVRAPTELSFLSVDHAVLHHGRVSARVPEGAIGFRLDAPGLNVVDLGTEFSLAVSDSGLPKVHVFKGKVRAALPTLPASRTELNAGETASFDVATGLVTRGSNAVSDNVLSPFPRLDGHQGLPTTTGNIFFLRKAPPSVRTGTFEHDSILVFREQEDVALPNPVEVVRHVTNQYNSSQPSIAELTTLPTGTRVQSYLVHFDRVGNSWTNGVTARGAIRFDQPILGLVIEPKLLAQTDRYCCHNETAYENDMTRPLEMRYFSDVPDGHDEVYLSDDGHELKLTLRAGPYVDQFRVLVKVDNK